MSADPRDELVFLPLGGSNEIGMNLNAYGFGPADDRRWIVVDVGVTFGDSTTPGVDVIVRPAGGAPIRLLSVHLKAGCNNGNQRDEPD